jgi:hypothetical protein
LEELIKSLRNADTTLEDIRALERLSKSRKGKRRPGAPTLYSDETLEHIQSTVRKEMARLKAAGKGRAGPKTAIRSLVERIVFQKEGHAGLVAREDKIKSMVDGYFRTYEAARKRG